MSRADSAATITWEQCQEFHDNPQRNPVTRRPIDPNGRVAQSIRVRCHQMALQRQEQQRREQQQQQPQPQPSNTTNGRVRADSAASRASRTLQMSDLNLGHCLQFARYPNLNPITNRIINPSGELAQRIHRLCATIRLRDQQSQARMRALTQAHTIPVVNRSSPASRTPSQPSSGQAPAHTREDIAQLQPYISETEYQELLRRIEAHERGATRNQRTAALQRPVYRSTSASLNESELQQSCVNLLGSIRTPPFKSYGNKLKKICTDLVANCQNTRIESIRTELKRVYAGPGFRLNMQPTSKIFMAAHNALKATTLLTQQEIKNVFRGEFTTFTGRFFGQEGVGVGVTKTFIQMMLDEIRDDEFFVPAEEGSSRYVMNPVMTKEKLVSMGYRVDTDDDVKGVFTLMGKLFSFCIRYDIPLGFSLSRAILANIIYRDVEIDDDEYVMYYLLEMPQMSSSVINTLQDPSSFEVAFEDAEFNDYYPLVAENKPITKDNFKEYLRLVAKHQLTKQIAVGANDTSKNLKAFLSGFYIRKKLRALNTTVGELDKLMHGATITNESIREWLTPGRVTISTTDQHENQLGQWLKEIMLSEGNDFPIEEITHSPAGTQSRSIETRKKDEFIVFMGKLMFFWTSLRKLDNTQRYQIIFVDGALPRASTCFYQLKLPRTIQTKDELYRKLITAVYNVEQGVGLLGGKTKKSSKRHTSKKN